MSKVVSARQALEHIADGATVGILGSGGGVCEPTYLLKQLGEYYKETGAPRDLTLLHANGIGDKDTYGTDALAGNVRSPKSAFEKLPLDAKKVAPRCAAKGARTCARCGAPPPRA